MQLDHITFACDSLAQAQRYCEAHFGTALPAGGEHPLMGTHNVLTQLSVHTFLEFIAINPAAPAPKHPRWFNLDALSASGALKIAPRLIGWVASVKDIAAAQALLPFAPTQVLRLRRGEFEWLMGVPEDGTLPCGGLAPTLIQWPATSPVAGMKSVGITLESLDVCHPQAAEWHAHCAQFGWQSHDATQSDNHKVQWRRENIPKLNLTLRSAKGLHHCSA